MTFDYELWLGRNFLPADKVLFEPTARILELCNEIELPVTFFPDVCSVWAHRKYELHEYADKFEAQLIEAFRGGHDVQLHLHPHWLNSTFKNGEWFISTEKMYLHELGYGDGPDSAGALISKGISYLNDLIRPLDDGYECRVFRAAGAALQPDERKLIKILLDCGIKMDVSVSKYLTLKLDTLTIDYTAVPAKSIWYMSPGGGIEQEAESGLLEVPIATFNYGMGQRVGFLLRRLRSLKERRGTTISRAPRQSRLANARTMFLQNIRYVVGNPAYLFSCDTKGFNLEMLLGGFKNYLMKHAQEDTVYVTMINHPKLMFGHQIEMLRQFVNRTRQEYDIHFTTCTQAYEDYSRISPESL